MYPKLIMSRMRPVTRCLADEGPESRPSTASKNNEQKTEGIKEGETGRVSSSLHIDLNSSI